MEPQAAQLGKFFVYGTLQQGEERAPCWPRAPLRVELAFTFAQLHDLGPYPAMVPGADRVLGELWSLAAEDMPITLQTLDAVEGFQQGGPDWYVRRTIVCYTLDGQPHEAHAYFWGQREAIDHRPLVPCNAAGCRDWKAGKNRRGS